MPPDSIRRHGWRIVGIVQRRPVEGESQPTTLVAGDVDGAHGLGDRWTLRAYPHARAAQHGASRDERLVHGVVDRCRPAPRGPGPTVGDRGRSRDTARAASPGQGAGVDDGTVIPTPAHHHVVAIRERLDAADSYLVPGFGADQTVGG